jgi:DNA-binding beta-propeller fold protein YncE
MMIVKRLIIALLLCSSGQLQNRQEQKNTQSGREAAYFLAPRFLGETDLKYPEGLAVTDSGAVIIADRGSHQIWQVGPGESHATNIAGAGLPGFAGDRGMAKSALFCLPNDVAVDRSGNVYIADTFNNRIRRISSNGQIDTIVGGDSIGDGGSAEAASLSLLGSVEVFDNVLYVADSGHHRIRAINLQSHSISSVAGDGSPGYNGDKIEALHAHLFRPEFIALDSKGNLYIADTYNNRVRRVEKRSGVITTIAGTGMEGYNGDNIPASTAKLFSPEGLAFDDRDNIFIADMGNNRIRRIDSKSGNITTVAGIGSAGFNGDGVGTETALNFPLGLAFDKPRHLLLVSDLFNHRIRALDLVSGRIVTLAGNGIAGYSGDGLPATDAQLFNPEGITVDDDGNIYIADHSNDRIRVVDAKTRRIITLLGPDESKSGQAQALITAPLFRPNRITFAKGVLYATEAGDHIIRAIDPKKRTTTIIAGKIPPRVIGRANKLTLSLPVGIALDGNFLFVADTGYHRILRISLDTWRSDIAVGTGSPGDQIGKDGPTTELNTPQALAIGADGSLYVADAGNNRILRVSRQGEPIVIVHSGLDSFDRELTPEIAAKTLMVGVAALEHNLIIVDIGNGRVRELNMATGTLATIAGEPAEEKIQPSLTSSWQIRLNHPTHAIIGQRGSLIISDTDNHRIVEFPSQSPPIKK